MLKWIWCGPLPIPIHHMGSAPKRRFTSACISTSQSEPPLAPFLEDVPLWRRKRKRVCKLLSGQACAKCLFYHKNHLIMESHLKQDFSQRGVGGSACVRASVCVCVGVSKATESWHTSFDVRSPVLVCRVAQQDDRSGDECRTVSKFIREGPLLPSVRAASGKLQRCECAPSTLPALVKLWAP